MTKREMINNVARGSIPASIVIFGVIYFLCRNIYISSIVASLFLLASLYSNVAKYSDASRRATAGVIKHKFQSKKVYDLITKGDLGPALCFEMENENYLLVNGQWIFNPDIYGEEAQQYYEEDSAFLNGYKRPYSFPAKEFEIWTSDLDGKPIRINILGDYLEPEEIPYELPGKYADSRFTVVSARELNIKDCQQCRGDRE